jgi:hypothetical protein
MYNRLLAYLLYTLLGTVFILMKKIVVAYWKERDLIPYFEHNSEFEYSVEKQSEIVNIIIERGLSVMVRPNIGTYQDTLLIYIDKGRFRQS